MIRVKLLLLFLYINSALFAQSFSFEKAYQFDKPFQIEDVIVRNNNYFLLCNYYENDSYNKSFLLSLDLNGDTLFKKNIQNNYSYFLSAFKPKPLGSLAFVGTIDSSNTNFAASYDAYFVETDTFGNYIKSKSYNAPIVSSLNDLLIVDTSMYMLGFSSDTIKHHNANDLLILKTNFEGGVSIQKTIDIGGYDFGNSIYSTLDGNIVIGGTLSSDRLYAEEIFLTPNLDTNAVKTYFKCNYDTSYVNIMGTFTAKVTSDNKIIMPAQAFGVFIPSNLTNRMAFLKTDSAGNLLHSKIFDSNSSYDRPRDVFELPDKNYLFVGTYNFSFANTRPDGGFYAIKTDTAGNVIWEKKYGDSNYQELLGASLTPDGSVILVGYSYNNSTHKRSGYVVKTDGDGNVGIESETNTKTEFIIYPNPANEVLFVQSQNKKIESYRIKDMIGHEIQSGVLSESVHIDSINPGLYILEVIYSDGNIGFRKFIKNH